MAPWTLLDSLVCGLPKTQRERRRIVILTAFSDDSGSDGTTPFFVLAGYVAEVERWNAFSEDWGMMLERQPRIEYFKMREAESRRGQFGGWSIEQAVAKQIQLAECIKRHARFGIGSFVSHRAYNAIMRDRLPPTCDSPYWLCFMEIVQGLINVSVDSEVQKVNFVFDTQGEGYERRGKMSFGGLREIFQEMGIPHKDIIGSISYDDDRNVLPLQAADMLAWHMRRHTDKALSGINEERPVADILWSIPTVAKAWHPSEMEQFVDLYQKLHPETASIYRQQTGHDHEP
jgi:hypothetical protein